MEGKEEDMEVDAIMQPDNKSIGTESDQFNMEDISEEDCEHVTNQEPLLVQETFTPTKQVSNPLLVQLV